MDLKNKNVKNDNIPKIKYFNTESIPKAKTLLSISPKYIDNFNKLSYKLFKLNEKNRRTTKYNSNLCNIKELFSNILVKNYKKKHYIKSLNELNLYTESNTSNNNYTYTINNFQTPTYSGRTTMKKFHKSIKNNNTNSFKRCYLLPKMTLINFKLMNNLIRPNNNKKEKINFCLAPLLKTIRSRSLKSKRREENEKKNPSHGKDTQNNKEKIFRKINSSSTPKTGLQKKKNFLTINTNKGYVESITEENDMKPKIRFINLKKHLMEETLKINKMFTHFHRQINEQKKIISFVRKQTNKSKDINKNNI